MTITNVKDAPLDAAVTPAVQQAARAMRPDFREDLSAGVMGDFATARAGLVAALEAAGLRDEIGAELFGGPDLKVPHMVQREEETYLDFCDRIAVVVADVVRMALVGAVGPLGTVDR